MMFPDRVWEMGDESPEGKQLWFSREATADDHARRSDLEKQYRERQDAREPF